MPQVSTQYPLYSLELHAVHAASPVHAVQLVLQATHSIKVLLAYAEPLHEATQVVLSRKVGLHEVHVVGELSQFSHEASQAVHVKVSVEESSVP